MSGGVGPCGDIGLTKEEHRQEQEQEEQELLLHRQTQNDEKDFPNSTTKQPPPPHRSPMRRGLFSLRQLNMLALIIVLSASGMVSAESFSFVILSFLYMYFISKVAFPTLSPTMEPPIFGDRNRILRIYMFAAAVIGLFLPVAYIFEGILEGDKEGIKAAAPHVFLLASQVFMEGVAWSDRFSLPIRVFVPVVYNSARIYTLMEWVRSEVTKVDEEYGGSARRLFVGRMLAVANMAFWSFNLFGFLVPVYLPMAFKRYYGGQKIKV